MFSPTPESFLLRRETTVQKTVISGTATEPGFPLFSQNSESFLLRRETTVQKTFISGTATEPGFPLFSPTPESFLLRRNVIIGPDLTPTPKSLVREFTPEAGDAADPVSQLITDSEQSKVKDWGKRNFLKVAGIAGVSLVSSLVLPKKAEALIIGSSPTTGVVGVKDSTNTRINPATEETASSLLKTSDLTFDSGALEVKVASTSGEGSSSFSDSGSVAKSALVDSDRHVQVDVLSSALPTSASTETTLETISFGGFKFTIRLAVNSGDSNVEYVGEASIGTATSAASWRIKKINSTSGVVIQWADTGVFDQVWDNRESLTYT